MKTLVSRSTSFDAAHFLPNYRGKCANLHGHRWTIEIGVSGTPDPDTGMVIDFSVLKTFLQLVVVEQFDHSLLNDQIENPTAENLACKVAELWNDWFWGKSDHVELEYVKVWETPISCVTYYVR